MECVKGKERTRIKRQFLRSGVDWVWDKPHAISWSYYLPVPGRTSDRKPRIKAQRIAEAMQNMPDLIAEHREERRQHRIQKKHEYAQVAERDELIQAASTRLTDMRDLVKQFHALDDSFFDGDDNYYELLAKSTEKESDIGTDKEVKSYNSAKNIEMRRKRRSEKFAKVLKSKPLLAPELDTIQERMDKSREWEKEDPEDGDYDDGRTWNARRSEKELAYIQQLANEPNLEKEEAKHSKRRVK